MRQDTPIRGKILTIYLLLMIIISFLNIFTSYDAIVLNLDDFKDIPRWLFLMTKILNLISIIFFVSIWNMKKWGVIGEFITILTSIILYASAEFPTRVYLEQFIGIVIFFLVVWKPYKRMT